MPHLIFLLFLFSDIRGVVLDPTSRPVAGARVQCGGGETTTDAAGYFTVSSVETCAATVTKAGFAARKIELDSRRANAVTLSLAIMSDYVTVSATRAPLTLDEAGVAATIVTTEQFEQRQFPTVYDVLRDVAGLNVVQTSRNGGLTDVFARGAEATGTLVLLDGMPLNEPGGELNLAGITSTGIDRMEVVRGPESALFGAEAASSVIQLFSQQGDPEASRPHATLSYERGSFQTDRWRTSVAGGLRGRLDYALSADQFHTVGEFPNDYFRDTTGVVNVGYHFSEQTQLRGIFRTFDSIVGTPNEVAYGIIDHDANEEDRDSSVTVRLDDARGSRYYQRAMFGYHRLRDRFNDQFVDGPYDVAALVRTVPGPVPRTYLVRLVDPSTPDSEAPPGTSIVRQSVTLYPFPGLTVTGRDMFDYQGTLNHKGGALVFGYNYQRQAGLISGRDVSRSDNGFFLHEQFSLTRRVFVTGGARLERSSTFGTKFTPRASLSFQALGEHGPLSATWLRFSAARGITEPTLVENFARESFYVGNPLLRPEITNTFEAGITQEWLHRRVRTDVSLFRNAFRDLIVFDFSQALGSWLNVDESWARGVETNISARLARGVSLHGAYMLLFTRVTRASDPTSPITGVGQELVRRPRNSGSAYLTIAPRRWSFLAGARFVGERQDADLFGVNRNPGYQSVFVSGSWRLNRHASPFLRIDNLLNARYQEVLGYSSLSRSATGGVRLEW